MTRHSQRESLRDFAVRVYAVDGVARACLQAQDRYDMDVNLILYACWLAQDRRALSLEDLRAAEDACRDHRQRHVLPLREQRRALKGDGSKEAAYEAAKAGELEAEFQQLAILEALPQPMAEAGTDHLARNLQNLCQHYAVQAGVLNDLQSALGSALVSGPADGPLPSQSGARNPPD